MGDTPPHGRRLRTGVAALAAAAVLLVCVCNSLISSFSSSPRSSHSPEPSSSSALLPLSLPLSSPLPFPTWSEQVVDAPIRTADNLAGDTATYLRVRGARVSGDRITVPVRARDVHAPAAATAVPRAHVVHVESQFGCRRARVEFVAENIGGGGGGGGGDNNNNNDEKNGHDDRARARDAGNDATEASYLPPATCPRDSLVEERPAVLLDLTHFALKNLAHFTFDLMYPLYATIVAAYTAGGADGASALHDGDAAHCRRCGANSSSTGRRRRPLLIVNRTAVDRNMPDGGSGRIERLHHVFLPLVDEIVTVSGDNVTSSKSSPASASSSTAIAAQLQRRRTACFRDLLLGAREQPLRKSNWEYITRAPHVVMAERAALLRGYADLMRYNYHAACRQERRAAQEHGDQPQYGANRPHARRTPHAVRVAAGGNATDAGADGENAFAHVAWRAPARHATSAPALERGAVLLDRTSSRRRLLNAERAAQRLNATHARRLGDLPWCAQYSMLHRSERIVGMHGAEWAHLLSIRHPERATAVEIFPPCARTVTFFGAVARHLGMRHHVYVVRNASAASYDARYPPQQRCIEAARAGGALGANCCFDASVRLGEDELDRVAALL